LGSRSGSSNGGRGGIRLPQYQRGLLQIQPRRIRDFVRYSQASLGEVGEQLDEGVDRRYWSEEDLGEARALCKRTGAALGRLRRYLMTPAAREYAARIRNEPRNPEPK
jgi:hypothetical protein